MDGATGSWSLMPLDGYAALAVAVPALSIFNTISLFWLGLTVALNAERRTTGTWVAAGGLLLGGCFFAVHSVFLSDAANLGGLVGLWWRGGWLPFVAAPYLWYLVMAWYCGRLGGFHSRALGLVGMIGLLGLGPLLLANPLVSYYELAHGTWLEPFLRGRLPLLVLAYPAYSVTCILLALSVLARPGSTERFMGEVGQNRARPWLVAASATLLLVSVSVGAVVAWLAERSQEGTLGSVFTQGAETLLLLDGVIAAEVAVAVMLMGRAIVSYEIFTGKALPRGGLFRDWRWSLVLAASCGILIGGSVGVPIDPTYRLLLAVVAVVVVYTLASSRSYIEREKGVERLRPFVASQRLYEDLLVPSGGPVVDARTQFGALCEDVLGASVGHLVALGPLAPLCSPPLAYPPNGNDRLAQIDPHVFSTERICVPIDPAHFGGAAWAVPLWGERGLIGVFLVGEKRDGTLYTQEEIEVARSACERLVDARASAELARRLMVLQRERLAESRVLDQRTRQLLHDDVLPRLHAAMLQLGDDRSGQASEVVGQLADLHRTIAELLRTMPSTLAPTVARMGLVPALRQELEGPLGEDFESVDWEIDPEAEQLCEALPTLAAEVLFGAVREAVRNAAKHGRGSEPGRPLHLTIAVDHREALEVAVEDDGVGVDPSSLGAEGVGHGLVLHSTMLAVVGGSLTFDSRPGGPTRAVLTLPGPVLPEKLPVGVVS